MDYMDFYSSMHLELLDLINENSLGHQDSSSHSSHWDAHSLISETRISSTKATNIASHCLPSISRRNSQRLAPTKVPNLGTEATTAGPRVRPQLQNCSPSWRATNSEAQMASKNGRVSSSHNSNDQAANATTTSSTTNKRVSRLSERWSAISRLIRANRGRSSKDQIYFDGSYDELDTSSSTSENESESNDDTMAVEGGQENIWPELPQTFSRNPSPLSDAPPWMSRPVCYRQTMRHNYDNHGYTYGALNHVKRAWGHRLEQWIRGEVPTERTQVAWSDMPEADDEFWATPPEFGNVQKRKTRVYKTIRSEQLPRMGDLNKRNLRFPAAITLDYYFAQYETYTLSKMNYIYDMVYRAKELDRAREAADLRTESTPKLGLEHEASSRPCSMTSDGISSSSSSSASDSLFSVTPYASGSSLSGGEDDIPDYESFKDGILRRASEYGNPFFHPTLRSSQLDKSDRLKGRSTKGKGQRPWENSWGHRYEVLVNLLRVAKDIASYEYCVDDVMPEHVAQLVMTSKEVIFDPRKDASQIEEYVVSEAVEFMKADRSAFFDEPIDTSDVSINDAFNPHKRDYYTAEVDEVEDYSEDIRPENSRGRIGASLDPLAMFATSNSSNAGTSKRKHEDFGYDSEVGWVF